MSLIDFRKKQKTHRRASGLGRKHLRKNQWRNPYWWGFYSILVLLLLLIGLGVHSCTKKQQEEAGDSEEIVAEQEKETLFQPALTEQTLQIGEEAESEYGVLLELQSGKIIADRSSGERMNPASMTKILTLLVAAEQIPDRRGTFTMTEEIGDYCYTNDCSVVGYQTGEAIPIVELFYGCIQSSGADASLALAEVAAGSHEAFVALMNGKIRALGRANTAHFTNCVGVYDKDHYCTAQDMAVFLKAALDNPFCRMVLSTRVYQSSPTDEHPEGMVLSNWFIRRIEDRDAGDITVLGGKTGYVVESKNCAASFGKNSAGKEFICVTGKGSGSWQVLDDHAAIYKKYCSKPEGT
ncbi:MAG: D-alanyl-D-alanine carboxypeptidase [Clostridia bacterium]|nr:D-alanyl-D-alanine carboxypeptidase [Clostridia bacterium]